MLKQLSSACLAAVCLALPGLAQGNCSTLDVTTQLHPTRPLQTVTVDVQGTLPNSMVVLAISPKPGTTTINMRAFGMLTLGLEAPFTTMLVGLSDPSGDLKREYLIPDGLGVTRYLQSVTLSVSGNTPAMPLICTSNVTSIDL